MDDRPIGVFDSGFGGLTITRALVDLAPAEDIVYIGDTARYPYGPRPQSEVLSFARQISERLVHDHGVKMVVVACNTAAAAALGHLERELDVPVLGVVDPGLRAAVRATRNGKVAVIGTEGTIGSGAYPRAAAALGEPVELTAAACPGFVELVERGETEGPGARRLVEERLAPLRAAGVDTLLLGCTHYPFLKRPIQDVMGREVMLVDSAEETAFAAVAVMREAGLAAARRTGGHRTFCSSGDPELFASLGRRLVGMELGEVRRVDWEGVGAQPGLPARDGANGGPGPKATPEMTKEMSA